MKGVRKWMLVLSVLAIVTCLSAGTMAIYSTQLDSTMKTEVAAKRFVITSNMSEKTGMSVELAPTYSMLNGGGRNIEFSVSNFEDRDGKRIVAEVPIIVQFKVDLAGDVFYKTHGVEVKIIDADNKPYATTYGGQLGRPSWIRGYVPVFNSAPKINLVRYGNAYNDDDSIVLPAGVATTRNFYLRFQWVGNQAEKPNAEDTRAGVNTYTGSVSLTVTGIQQTGTTPIVNTAPEGGQTNPV